MAFSSPMNRSDSDSSSVPSFILRGQIPERPPKHQFIDSTEAFAFQCQAPGALSDDADDLADEVKMHKEHTMDADLWEDMEEKTEDREIECGLTKPFRRIAVARPTSPRKLGYRSRSSSSSHKFFSVRTHAGSSHQARAPLRSSLAPLRAGGTQAVTETCRSTLEISTRMVTLLFTVILGCLNVVHKMLEIVQSAVQPFLQIMIVPILMIGVPLFCAYWWAPTLVSQAIAPVVATLPGAATIGALYCGTVGIGCSANPRPSLACAISGIGCKITPVASVVPVASVEEPITLSVAEIAQRTAQGAKEGKELLQLVTAVGRPNTLVLSHAAAWELSFAIGASTYLGDRDTLGASLMTFGYELLEVNDKIIAVNAKASFIFTKWFDGLTRVHIMIEAKNANDTYSNKQITRQLNGVFQRLEADMDSLIGLITDAIPVTSDARETGNDIRKTFTAENAALSALKGVRPIWQRIKEVNSWKSQQLQKDLDLVQRSQDTTDALLFALDYARNRLLSFRETTSLNKASVIGQHLGDGEMLLPEHEVRALRDSLSQFGEALEAAKRPVKSKYNLLAIEAA